MGTREAATASSRGVTLKFGNVRLSFEPSRTTGSSHKYFTLRMSRIIAENGDAALSTHQGKRKTRRAGSPAALLTASIIRLMSTEYPSKWNDSNGRSSDLFSSKS